MRRTLLSIFATIVIASSLLGLWCPPAPPPSPVPGSCSHDNWCWQNPLPWGNAFSCIEFTDTQNGYGIGFKGNLWHTPDQGETWEVIDPAIEGIEYDPCVPRWWYDSWDLKDMCFMAQGIGWAVGDKGVVLYTANGGETWTLQHGLAHGLPNDPERDPNLNSVFFINGIEGWAVGWNYVDLEKRGIILHTSDVGRTWRDQDVDPSIESLSDIFFVDDQNGWAVGKNGAIIHTTNGGQNWQTQNSGTEQDLNAVTFIDRLNGWAAGWGVILHTMDGGNSWEVQKEGDFFLWSIAFRDTLTGLAAGNDGIIFLTINGGEDWLQTGTDAFPTRGSDKPRLTHVTFKDNIAWIVGHGGCILRSEDSGIHWVEKGSTGPLHYLKYVTFVDSVTGWALSNSLIMNTTDGGTRWREQFPRPTSGCEDAYLYSMSFADPAYGWVICRCITDPGFPSYIILRTTDGGQTWSEKYSSEPDLNLYSITFMDRPYGWVVGRTSEGETVILHSIDSGDSWVEQYRSSYLGYYHYEHLSLLFVDRRNGWVIPRKTSNKILHTTDGGNTWHEEQIQELFKIDVVAFVSPREGWMFGVDRETGRSGTLLHTTNAGQTWEKIDYQQMWDPDTPSCILVSETSMAFIDENRGWLCGYYGEILYTTDGGQTWIHQETGTRQILSSMAFFNVDSGWAVGHNGTILEYQRER